MKIVVENNNICSKIYVQGIFAKKRAYTIMSYDIGLAFALVHQRREIVPLFFKEDVLMKKILSVFIDESGDFGFIKDASKYYLIIIC